MIPVWAFAYSGNSLLAITLYWTGTVQYKVYAILQYAAVYSKNHCHVVLLKFSSRSTVGKRQGRSCLETQATPLSLAVNLLEDEIQSRISGGPFCQIGLLDLRGWVETIRGELSAGLLFNSLIVKAPVVCVLGVLFDVFVTHAACREPVPEKRLGLTWDGTRRDVATQRHLLVSFPPVPVELTSPHVIG